MGFSTIFSDFYDSLSFATEAHAEAPAEEEKEEGGEEDGDEEKGGDEGGEGEGGEEGGEEEEEEEDEEEEEEPEDPKPKLEEDCARSAQCSGYKHHYDECAERVQHQHGNPNHKGPKEDCVEECSFASPLL
ncbi:hypothetical protein MMC21_002710 [Puttea exsequens]|nr:hypothetical protein [Puttea exsequens]